ncbi:MAG: SCO2523 family variant P-loop protein [Actinomycetales bacterium]
MLVFAASDKGGTGRSVSGANIAYRSALQGRNTCYVDFDFGSPTAGAIFGVSAAAAGTASGRGSHAVLQGGRDDPEWIDIWDESEDTWIRQRPPGAGRLQLLPGDLGGSEFATTPETLGRVTRLFRRLEEEYDLSIVDLSAGRSYAAELALHATAEPELAEATARWLVFHRWTRQHVVAAGGFVHGPTGLLATGQRAGHPEKDLGNAIRIVRTAVVDPRSTDLGSLRAAQLAWFRERDRELHELAANCGIGEALLLGTIPLDPLLQWREQLLTERDVHQTHVANISTVEALSDLSAALTDDRFWQPR